MERLQVILEMVAGQYKREAKDAATATAQIGTSAKTSSKEMGGFKGAIADNKQELTNFGKAAVAGLAVAGVGAVVAFAKSTVTAASNLEESLNAVNVQFGESAEGIHALGEESVDSFGLSQRAFNEFAVQFSAFADNIAGASGRDVVDIVDEMATRIADFASVHNLSLEEASVVANSTLAGETEAFRRFGGDVSAAAVEMKGLEMGLGETSAQLSEQEKILIRYELFMEQTEKTAGDFANTQGGLANSTKSLAATFEDFQASIGESLLPTLASAAGFLTDLLNAIVAAEEGWQSFGRAIDEGRAKFGFTGKTALETAEAYRQQQAAAEEAATSTAAHTIVLADGTAVMEAYNDMAVGQAVVLADGTAVLDKYNEMGRVAAARQFVLAQETEATTAQMRSQFDLVDGRLDTFGAYTLAVDAQAAAQAEVNRLIEEGKVGTPEYIAAVEDLAGAMRDTEGAELAVVEAGGLTREEFIKQQVGMGLLYADAVLLADKYDTLFTPRTVTHTIINNEVVRGRAGTNTNISGRLQGGGHARTGNLYQVGEGNLPELMMIPGDNGRVFSNSDSRRLIAAMSSSGGGISIGSQIFQGLPGHLAHQVGQAMALELRMAQ